MGHRCRDLSNRRQQAGKAINRLNFIHTRMQACRCLGNVIQGLAHDPLSHVVRPLKQATDLGIDARAKLARRLIGRELRIGQ